MSKPIKTLAEARRMSAVVELDQVNTPADARLDRVIQLARTVFDLPTAVISVVGEHETWAKAVVGLTGRRAPNTASFCARCVNTEQGLVVEDARLDPNFHQNPFVRQEAGLRFYAGIPLRGANNQHVGALCVMDRKPRRWSARDQAILADLARWAEAELAICKLEDFQRHLIGELHSMRRKALLDPLTGCWNRHALSDLFEQEVTRSRGSALTLMLVDVDHFKRVNDHHGHPIGDHCLLEAAHRIRASLRSDHAMVRYGGDEFVLLMGQCDEREARGIAERMRQAVADSPLPTPAGPLPMSLSIGLVTVPTFREETLDTLIGRADQALLNAKKLGRNRVETTGQDQRDLALCAPIQLHPMGRPA